MHHVLITSYSIFTLAPFSLLGYTPTIQFTSTTTNTTQLLTYSNQNAPTSGNAKLDDETKTYWIAYILIYLSNTVFNYLVLSYFLTYCTSFVQSDAGTLLLTEIAKALYFVHFHDSHSTVHKTNYWTETAQTTHHNSHKMQDHIGLDKK